MVLAKKWQFFGVFILGKISQEDVYYDILEGKNTFVEYKDVNFREYRPGKRVLRYSRKKKLLYRLHKKKLKKSKNWDFFKGVSPLFWSKIDNFSMFFLGKTGQENSFYDILEKKNGFLD